MLPVLIAYDIYPEISENFAKENHETLDIDIETTKEPKKAVVGMDIVVTCGPILKNPNPVIERGWLNEGSFASPVDFDSYWTGGALKEADKIVTDDINQMNYY